MKNLIYKIFLIVVFFQCSYTLYSQNKTIDSLLKVLQTQKEDTSKVNILNALAAEYRYNKSDTPMYFANQALVLSTRLGYEMGIGDSKLSIGMLCASLAKYDEGVKSCNDASTLYNKLLLGASEANRKKILEKIGRANNYIGHNRMLQGNYPEGLKYLLLALKTRTEIGDKYGIGETESNIGFINAFQGNYTEALKHYAVTLEMSIQLEIKTAIANAYMNIANIYSMQGSYPKALQNYSSALKISEEAKDDYMVGNIYLNLGDLSEKHEDYNVALKDYFLALKILERIGDPEHIMIIYISLGSVYTKEKKFNDASGYLNKALNLSKTNGSLENIKLSYEYWTKLDSAQSNFKQALEHYKLFISYRDSLVNTGSAKKLVQQQMEYDFDRKEAATKAEQGKKDAEGQRAKNVQYFAIVALGILVLSVLIIAFIQWRSNKHKQKANILLQHQKEKVESTLSELKSTQSQLIQSEKMASLGELTAGIAHEIQNPLNFVNNFSEVSKELLDEMKDALEKGDTQEAKEIMNDVIQNLEKINHHGKRADGIVKGMLQHSRSTGTVKELTDINALADEYIRLCYHGLRAKDKSFNATIKTDFDASIEKINIIPQDIGRVVLNLINNAFYAVDEKKTLRQAQGDSSYEPTVSISTKKVGDKVLISVSDNGNGIPQKILDKIFQPFFTTKPTGQGTGLGLSLSYDIVKAHGGEIKVETRRGEGSEFVIQLPV